MTNLPCGREQLCSPCDALIDQDKKMVCAAVSAVICEQRLEIEKSSLSEIREAIEKSFIEQRQEHVNHIVRNAAFASAIELGSQ